MSTQGEIFLHVLEIVLEINPTEIAALHKNGMKTMTMLHKIRLSTLDKWHEKDRINTGTWQELGYFVMYLKYYKRECTDANLMLMTVQL